MHQCKLTDIAGYLQSPSYSVSLSSYSLHYDFNNYVVQEAEAEMEKLQK